MKPSGFPKSVFRTLVLFLSEFRLVDQAQPAETIPFYHSQKGRVRPLHRLLSRQGKLNLSICTGSEEINITFLHHSANAHLTQVVLCQQQPISSVQTHYCTVYIS